MSFSIYIYESDKQIFESVKQRLSHYFPEAYIMGQVSSDTNYITNISDYHVVLYDNREFSISDKSNKNNCVYISLFSEDSNGLQIIDCSRLSLLIKNAGQTLSSSVISHRGKVNLLIPYAYIDEREIFIKNKFDSSFSNMDYCLRIDLMSGLRMPTSFKTEPNTGSLTDLIRCVEQNDFSADKLLGFVNPDSSGFLTPGKPTNPDDVFDADFDSILKLMKSLRTITTSSSIKFDALVVCEGWKTKELISLCQLVDEVHILTPSRVCNESCGIEDFVASLKRSLNKDTNLTLHYIDDYKEEIEYESTRIKS